MPTLSYCQFVNNCSPNLLLFKVDRYEKLYFDPFFTCRAFWPCPTQLLIYISQCPSCPALLLPTLWSTFALPLLICPSAMTCPALYYPALCPVRSCPANSTISGRSDRKVLRLIYRLGRFISSKNSQIMSAQSLSVAPLAKYHPKIFLGSNSSGKCRHMPHPFFQLLLTGKNQKFAVFGLKSSF